MQRQNGFTLVELLMVVVVLGILASVAIPSFTLLIQNSRVTSSTNSLIGLLATARNEAVSHRTRTVVCGTANLQACQNSPWTGQIMLFRDINNNGQCDGCNAGAGELVKVMPPSDGVQIAGANSITYQGAGTIAASATLSICDSRGTNSAKAVQVTIVGQSSAGGTAACP